MPNHNPRPDCPKCHGSGWFMYDHNHSTVCGVCCRHDQGFWPLTEHYQGYANGDRWCCLGGCGFALPFNPEEAGPSARTLAFEAG